MLLPLFEETEVSLPWWFRAILYGLGLAWLFVAVAIISDIFMATIEHITAKQSVVTDKTGAKILVRTWNATVANLTLMALGSSAPEILLALVETVGNNFYAGDLGPSTIVGSAAFNLLVIIAVCVTAIPEDIEGGRKIDDLNVYCVTAISSLFAYAWMVIVLKFNSPDVVELPEAAATFSFFWIMVLVAYIVDRGFICSKRATEGHVVSVGELKEAGDFLKDNEISLDKIIEELDKGTLSELTEKEKEMVLMMKVKVSNDATKPKSRREKARAIKRQQERQNMVRDPIVDALGIELTEKIKTLTTLSSCGEANEEEYDFARQIVRFVSPEYSCLECDGVVDVSVIRFPAKGPLRVEYKTVEDTATGDVDYKHIEGILDFIDGEASKKISVEIIDDDEVEEDESFFVVLSNARPNAKIEGGECRVTIIDDDLPGEFGFEKKDTAIKCSEAAGVVRVPITRRNGASGCVSIEWVTEDVTALAGSHYVKSSGIVEFEPGEIVREIEVSPKYDSIRVSFFFHFLVLYNMLLLSPIRYT
jgi:solute carrier family 8 (sodium/calcium exchanger)